MTIEQESGSAQPDYVARLRQNIPWLAAENGMSMKRVAGVADIALQTIRNWLLGDGSPTLSKLGALADAFGVDATDLLLPHEELQAKVEMKGFRPFVLRPDGNRSSSLSSRTSSGATAKVNRAKRTLLATVVDLYGYRTSRRAS